jgi:hypothetical protein
MAAQNIIKRQSAPTAYQGTKKPTIKIALTIGASPRGEIRDDSVILAAATACHTGARSARGQLNEYHIAHCFMQPTHAIDAIAIIAHISNHNMLLLCCST